MNAANATVFVVIGIVMWLTPHAAPGLFRHVAIDGASTRALWSQLMGLVQCAIGASFFLREGWTVVLEGIRKLGARRGAVATGEWQPDAVPENLVFVDFAAREMADAAHALGVDAFSASEARLTNLVGRAADGRQAA